MLASTLPTGILLAESTLNTRLFAILAAFVALNTLIYATLAIAKMMPKVYPADWFSGRNRRRVNRSIHPGESP